MRVVWVALGVLAMTQGTLRVSCQPAEPAGQLVGEVVYNEINDHQRHGYWQYWVERRSQTGTSVEEQVETADGPISRLMLSNGHALGPEAEKAEQERLQELLTSPSEQARQQKQYDENEERIGRILSLLPSAFVFQYDGEENGRYRLRFRPNRGDPSCTIESRILHAMSGTLWVDARSKRVSRLEGHVDENVDFGFGILGRLYKGGWFRLERVQVSATDWKTEVFEVHMNIRALLVKTFARETSELRGGFVPVPTGMSLTEGLETLNQSPGQSDAAVRKPPPTGAAGSQPVQTALAMRP
ncbi:MAG: hypothetical protein ABSG10_10085 [Terracidiphilus sp.]